MQSLSCSLFTTNGDDVANHGGDRDRDANRSGGRDRRDGPTHAHARVRARGRL